MTNERQERNQRRRQDMISNIQDLVEKTAEKHRPRDPSNPEELKSIQRDAALLVEFASRISDLPLHEKSNHKALKDQARKLVEHLELKAFEEAIKELRVLFLALDQEAGMSAPGTLKTITDRGSESVLEWLVRLDLHRAFVEEKNLGQDFLANREAWLALDEAFGFPIEFWSGFCEIRDA